MEEVNSSLETENSLIPHAVKAGVILAVVSIILSAILYAVNEAALVAWYFGLIVLIGSLAFVIIRGNQYRKSVGGYLDFGSAFKHGFVSFIISAIIGLLFNILLYTVIDPDLGNRLIEVSAENAAKMAQGFGAPESELDNIVTTTRDNMEGQFGIGGLLKQFGISVVVLAIISLITGLIVRKKEPIEDF